MARTLQDARLDSREARLRLKARGKPYWRTIEPGLHQGYRRLRGRPGTWSKRLYVGGGTYVIEVLDGVADDYAEADGVSVLSFAQAQRAMLASKPKPDAGVLTVRAALAQYLTHLSDSGKSIDDARYRIDALILPALGDLAVEELATEQLQSWLAALARTPAKRKGPASGEEARRQRLDSEQPGVADPSVGAQPRLAPGAGGERSCLAAGQAVQGRGGGALALPERRRGAAADATPAVATLRKLVAAGLQTGARYSASWLGSGRTISTPTAAP